MKYRKKPVEVEAVRFAAGKVKPVLEFCPAAKPIKDGNKVDFFVLYRNNRSVGTVHPGDWIVLTPDGEFAAYKSDEFDATFEAAE